MLLSDVLGIQSRVVFLSDDYHLQRGRYASKNRLRTERWVEHIVTNNSCRFRHGLVHLKNLIYQNPGRALSWMLLEYLSTDALEWNVRNYIEPPDALSSTSSFIFDISLHAHYCHQNLGSLICWPRWELMIEHDGQRREETAFFVLTKKRKPLWKDIGECVYE